MWLWPPEKDRNDYRAEVKQGKTVGEGRSERGRPKMADPHLFWKKGWQGTSQLRMQTTCKYLFFSFCLLFVLVYVCVIHTSHDTPTADTHALSLSLSLAQAHTESPTLKHTCSLSHSPLSSLTAKERGGGGGGEVSLGGLKYKEERKRAAAFLLALSGCLCVRQGEANK